MKQIAVLCDQTPDTFPWHRLDRATVLALMENEAKRPFRQHAQPVEYCVREAMLHQQMSDHQFSLIEQIRAIKLQRLAVGRALHVNEIARLIDYCLHDEGSAGVFYSVVGRDAPSRSISTRSILQTSRSLKATGARDAAQSHRFGENVPDYSSGRCFSR